MKQQDVIEDIITAFGTYALGDIKHNADRTISCFILISCFIDQLAGYRYNSKHNGRFELFIKEYLPHYSPLRLYETLRNKIVHNYSVENAYKLTSDINYSEQTWGAKNMDVLCTHAFIKELESVFKEVECQLRNDKKIRDKAILRNIDCPVLTHQIYNVMDYTSDQAEYLIEYYSPKMIGKYLDKANQVKVIKIEKRSETNGESYMVAAVGEPMAGVVNFFREIGQAAKHFNLESPEEVLKGRS